MAGGGHLSITERETQWFFCFPIGVAPPDIDQIISKEREGVGSNARDTYMAALQNAAVAASEVEGGPGQPAGLVAEEEQRGEVVDDAEQEEQDPAGWGGGGNRRRGRR